MHTDYLSIYAFNDKEKEILNKNENIINEKVKLSLKDVKVYFYLKENKKQISVTDLVRKCLIKHGYDIDSNIMFKPRRKPKNGEFYERGSFWGCDQYRVDTFSRSLSKLVKAGLVIKRENISYNTFETIIKD